MRTSQKRELLLVTSAALFARQGYKHVTVRDITTRVGFSVGNFYRYFRSKEELYGLILDRLEQDGIRKADAIISRLHSPMNKLKALYWFVSLGLRHNAILRGIMLQDPRYIYPGMAIRQQAKKGLRSHVEQIVRKIIREGDARGVMRTGIYRNAEELIMIIFDTAVRSIEDVHFERLMSDLLLFLQRGLRRILRLRRRDERLDRRTGAVPESIEWLQ